MKAQRLNVTTKKIGLNTIKLRSNAILGKLSGVDIQCATVHLMATISLPILKCSIEPLSLSATEVTELLILDHPWSRTS